MITKIELQNDTLYIYNDGQLILEIPKESKAFTELVKVISTPELISYAATFKREPCFNITNKMCGSNWKPKK